MGKLLIITGPTASGKTALGLEAARGLNGEILSADSRQVYRGLDVVTGKDLPPGSHLIPVRKLSTGKMTIGHYSVAGISLWGLDIVPPEYPLSVIDYLEYARVVLSDIRSRDRLPVIVGGSVQYLVALLTGVGTAGIPPDKALRQKLSSWSVSRLQNRLRSLAPDRWQSLNSSDRTNPRRLVRAIEIALSGGDSPGMPGLAGPEDDVLIIALAGPYPVLYGRIDARVEARVRTGALAEVALLTGLRIAKDSPILSSLGYREFLPLIDKTNQTPDLAGAIQQWKWHEHALARRQMTWLRSLSRTRRVYRVDISGETWRPQALDIIRRWYNQEVNGQT